MTPPHPSAQALRLRAYLRHYAGCEAVYRYDGDPKQRFACTCGLDAALHAAPVETAQERINSRCPACGNQTLILGKCQNPCAIHDAGEARLSSPVVPGLREQIYVLEVAQLWLANSVPTTELPNPKPLPLIADLLARLPSPAAHTETPE